MAKRLALGPKLDTASAPGLRDQLLAGIDGDLALDGGAVEQLGALCLEVILSAAALARSAGHRVTVENVSDAMVENLGRFGLTPETLTEVLP